MSKNFYPLQEVNSWGNSQSYHENTFIQSFTLGISMENRSKFLEGNSLITHFKAGSGSPLSFSRSSGMSDLLSKDPAFKTMTIKFELEALGYFNRNQTMEGFNGSDVLKKTGALYIKDTWFMHTVLGGVQQVDAQIRSINNAEIMVDYRIWDHFGAGRLDAQSNLPGLPSMYWLQHNSRGRDTWKPFIWNIDVRNSTRPSRSFIKFKD